MAHFYATGKAPLGYEEAGLFIQTSPQPLYCHKNSSKTISLQVAGIEESSATWSLSVAPSEGTVSIPTPSSGLTKIITYTSLGDDFIGSDTFEITVTNGVVSDKMVVNVTLYEIAFVESDPQSLTVQEELSNTITLNNSSSTPNDVAMWSIVSDGAHGSAALPVSPTGNTQTITYTATGVDYFGPDSFTVMISDGVFSDTLVVNVTITNVYDIITFITPSQTLSVIENATVPVTATIYINNPDIVPVTWSISTPASKGIASFDVPTPTDITTNIVKYIPSENERGNDSFVLSVSDGTNTITLTILVRITPQVLFPTINPIDNLPRYELYVTTAAFQKKMQIDQFNSMEFVTRFNDIGSFVLELDVSDANKIQWSDGLVVERNGSPIFFGMVTEFGREFTRDKNVLTVSGTDTMRLLSDRLALPVPNPTFDGNGQPIYSTTGFDTRTGKAETIIKQYVSRNIGPLAQVIRQHIGFTIQYDSALGDTRTGHARFDNLLEFIRDLALPVPISTGIELGFNMGGNGLNFCVYRPRDLTGSVVFSKDLGTMKSFKYTAKASDGNYIIAGGTGEDVGRIFYESGEYDSMVKYGRIERFLDSSSSQNITDLSAAIMEDLYKTIDNTTLEIEPYDKPSMTAIDDYWVGDKVTAIVDSEVLEEVIREATVKITRDRVEIIPVVGSPDKRRQGLLNTFANNRKFNKRIGTLERV